ncbi:tetratricopeptide repeat protein [Caenispirillum salinarum]|uniref:tetratricopeptide repeat protein n=1 Tax=Caenispirillum salinarum TaxID=859058 RepID=UPI00384B5947
MRPCLTLPLIALMLAAAPGLADDFAAEDTASRQAVAGLEAYAAYKMGDYDTARSLWEALAAKGNTTAMVNLANLFEQGQGTPADRAAALEWTRRAAEAGDTRAMVSLGVAHEGGASGLPRDLEAAERWFRKAAETGDADAHFNLGVLLLTNRGQGLETTPPDQRRAAARHLRAAAEAGHAEARPMLKIAEKGAD